MNDPIDPNRVRLLAATLDPMQIKSILKDDVLLDPFGMVQEPSALGNAVMAFVKRRYSGGS